MLQQHAFCYPWLCHDVIQHSFHHSFTHRFVQVPIHNPPRSANEADILTGPAKDGLKSALPAARSNHAPDVPYVPHSHVPLKYLQGFGLLPRALFHLFICTSPNILQKLPKT